MNNIVVTGLGVISALGDSVSSNHLALQQAVCGLSPLELFQTKYSHELRFGEIKTTNQKLKERMGITDPYVTRTTLLAVHALEEAITDSGLSSSEVSSEETALVVGNTVGGMCLTDELYRDANTAQGGSPYIASYDCASVTLYLQKRFGVKGVVNTINTACSSSANAILYASNLIKNGYARRAIAGGTDSLAKFTINGFNALGILAPQNCRPFDKNRNGLNLGEGAGFVVLEKQDVARKKYVSLSGYCNANDGFHPSAISENGEGPYCAMKGALQKAALPPGEIGYICSHGTGTGNNDEAESHAMLRIFGKVPPFASAKSKTGHTLGASAAIEAVFGILALVHQEIYPSLNFSAPIESTGLLPVREYAHHSFSHVMCNSFGFGGNCTSLVFSKE